MNARLIGQIAGAFIITFLLSRLALWILKRWDGGIGKLAVAHGSTLALLWTGYAFGSADGGPPNWSGGVIYAFPVFIWFVVDMMRGVGGVELPEESHAEPDTPPRIRRGAPD